MRPKICTRGALEIGSPSWSSISMPRATSCLRLIYPASRSFSKL